MKQPRNDVLYEVVTQDELELPLFVGTAQELAKFENTTPNNIYYLCKRYGDKSKYRKVKLT